VVAVGERGVWPAGAADATDLATFAARVQRLDEAAVIRLRMRSDEVFAAWAATGFDVLAARACAGRVRPTDLSCAADALLAGAGADGVIDPGFAMDSAWRGVLPPESGFVHVDDIPARVLLELAEQGSELSREHGRPPVSLLDQEVVAVSSGAQTVGIPMRCVFALTAMGFVPPSDDEIVRVRVLPAWLRLDARFGSVYRRRGDPALVLR